MIVSHEHRFIFLKSRKTAGTSVEIALSRACGPDDVITPISPADEPVRAAYGGRGPQNFDAPPLPRRAWNHMPASMVRQLVGRAVWRDYLTFSIERNPWDALVSLYHWRTREGEELSFEDFVWSDTVENYATRQSRAYRIDGELAVDEVCRYDTLDHDLGRIWRRLELPGVLELPHAKSQTRPHRQPYSAYYDDASRDRVAEVFAPTIEAFGFEF
ncbi:MAG: sulfotransferase family protein [Nocardioides sp.]|nr:sulfotransferase family protein [Nocardioides sp.]